MITLGMDGPEDLAEAIYLALVTVDTFNGRLGTKRWRNMRDKERARWVRATRRVIELYPAEGLALGVTQGDRSK